MAHQLKDRKKGSTKARNKRASKVVEWVGGLVTFPHYVQIEGDPVRPGMLILLDDQHFIVGHAMGVEEEVLSQAVGALSEAIQGRSQPTRLRVNSDDLSQIIQKHFPEIEVFVGQTPEVDSVLERMESEMAPPEREESYLTGGISAELMDSFFQSAAKLYSAKPWEVVPSDQFIFSVTIDQLGIQESVLSVIGQSGESFGVILFPSHDAFLRYCELSSQPASVNQIPAHIGLNFDDASDVAPTLRKEIAIHHWQVVEPSAYPQILAIESNLQARPLTRKDYVMFGVISEAFSQVVSDEQSLMTAWNRRTQIEKRMKISFFQDEMDIAIKFPFAKGM